MPVNGLNVDQNDVDERTSTLKVEYDGDLRIGWLHCLASCFQGIHLMRPAFSLKQSTTLLTYQALARVLEGVGPSQTLGVATCLHDAERPAKLN